MRGHKKVAELQKLTGYPKRTLYTWTAQLAETGNLKQKNRSGRPKHLNPAQRKHLGQIAAKQKCATSLEITETLKKAYPKLIISPRAVRDNLQKLGYKVCVPPQSSFSKRKR